jgi:hypothetical protein
MLFACFIQAANSGRLGPAFDAVLLEVDMALHRKALARRKGNYDE